MKCVIIAAGMGSRLRSVAPSKPLAPVWGVPLIERVARAAKAGGASGFVVVTGYEAEPIEAFLPGLSERIGAAVEAVRNPDWARPNGLSVLAAKAALGGEEFLLSMSDHLFEPAIVEAMLGAQRGEAELLLAVDFRLDNPLVDIDDVTKVAVGKGSHIAAIGKAIPRWDAFDTGIFRATSALLDAIRASVAAGGQGSLSEGVQRLADAGQARVVDIGDRWWIDVDDAPAMARAEETLPSHLV
jgi:1L-myo-inositol 1-phosphate cytidylyltransferase